MLGGRTFTSILFMNLHNFSKVTTFEELKTASKLYVLAFIQQISVINLCLSDIKKNST